ncbi:hypothetical protein ACH4UM_12670 [Streptomyces sp. NPDC020801]|uniref:hypothetical protein n=1 Tax=unclassified Streptomyces TaxID=2593676 RepID=UPI00379B45E8
MARAGVAELGELLYSGGRLGACVGTVVTPTVHEAAAVLRRSPEAATGGAGRPARCLGVPATAAQLP